MGGSQKIGKFNPNLTYSIAKGQHVIIPGTAAHNFTAIVGSDGNVVYEFEGLAKKCGLNIPALGSGPIRAFPDHTGSYPQLMK